MNMIKKAIGGLLAAVALTCLTGGASMAQTNTMASISSVNGTTTDFTFSGGIGGILQSTAAGVSITSNDPNGVSSGSAVAPVYFSFGPITETGPVSSSAFGSGATFSGGSFLITTGQNKTGTVLLSGNFAASALTTSSGSSGSVMSIGFGGVSYQPSQYLTTFLAKYGGTSAIGSFSMGLSGINPPLATGPGGGFTAFSAQGSGGSFDATSVPEPGTYAAFAFTGIGMMGLMLRARKARGNMAA